MPHLLMACACTELYVTVVHSLHTCAAAVDYITVAKTSVDEVCNVQDLVRAVGVSNYGPRQLERISNYLTERGVPLASAQVCKPRYSLRHGQSTL